MHSNSALAEPASSAFLARQQGSFHAGALSAAQESSVLALGAPKLPYEGWLSKVSMYTGLDTEVQTPWVTRDRLPFPWVRKMTGRAQYKPFQGSRSSQGAQLEPRAVAADLELSAPG